MENFVTVTSKLGSSLLERAAKSREDRIGEQCIAEVETIMARMDAAESRINSDTLLLTMLQKQVAAIEAGAFRMVKARTNNQVVILFEDTSLIEAGSMAELVSKGLA